MIYCVLYIGKGSEVQRSWVQRQNHAKQWSISPGKQVCHCLLLVYGSSLVVFHLHYILKIIPNFCPMKIAFLVNLLGPRFFPPILTHSILVFYVLVEVHSCRISSSQFLHNILKLMPDFLSNEDNFSRKYTGIRIFFPL